LESEHGCTAFTNGAFVLVRIGEAIPDGAVLVKDVTNVGSDKLTTGQATRATDVKIWFVMIKDAKGRFPKNRPTLPLLRHGMSRSTPN
jgi:hypothetical protein